MCEGGDVLLSGALRPRMKIHAWSRPGQGQRASATCKDWPCAGGGRCREGNTVSLGMYPARPCPRTLSRAYSAPESRSRILKAASGRA